MDRHVGGQVDGHRAVVLGGSIAGPFAAHMLFEHYAEVQVLDREDLDLSQPRSATGVPQARHIHPLLPRGREILEELFPAA